MFSDDSASTLPGMPDTEDPKRKLNRLLKQRGATRNVLSQQCGRSLSNVTMALNGTRYQRFVFRDLEPLLMEEELEALRKFNEPYQRYLEEKK